MILTVSDAQVTEGESGFLDVYFSVPSGAPALAFYMIELRLMDQQGETPAGVRFVYDDPAKQWFGEADSPVFPGSKAIQTATRPALPGAIAAANDFLLAGEQPITDGAGLLRLFFETDLGNSGNYRVTIESDELRTNLFDGAANPVAIQAFHDGTITVVPVPEPGTLALSLVGSLVLLVAVYRSRRRFGLP